MTEKQKQQLITIGLSALVSLVVAVAAVFGFRVAVVPFPVEQQPLPAMLESPGLTRGAVPEARFRSVIVDHDLDIGGDLTVDGAQTFTGNQAVTGGFTVSGATVLNGGLTMDSTKFTVADTSGNTSVGGTLTAAGAAALNGGITVDTNAFTVADTSGNTDIAGTLQYGASNLYPVGYGTSGAKLVVGSTTITGTAALAHGLATSVAAAGCTLAADPTTNEEADCTVTVSGTTVTGKVWKTDGSTAGDSPVAVNWWVLGVP
jgi:hypothetical protein